MCGITGYVGNRPAVETSIRNLKRLEYRGYDSAGVAYPEGGSIQIRKAAGKIVNLEAALDAHSNEAHAAIAHTRWATHGRPNESNAHPHSDCLDALAVVHNGIIENYAALRQRLILAGHQFLSDTDTEVLAHLIEEELSHRKTMDDGRWTMDDGLPLELEQPISKRESAESSVIGTESSIVHRRSSFANSPSSIAKGPSSIVHRRSSFANSPSSIAKGPSSIVHRPSSLCEFTAAARNALAKVEGSYAIAVVHRDHPDYVFVARKDSPLVIGLGDGENFLASDIPAVLAFTRKVIVLEDGDCALIEKDKVQVFGLDGEPRDREPLEVTWDDRAAEKGGFEHFMRKEIHEGPRTVRDTLRGRLSPDDRVELPNMAAAVKDWSRFSRISITACGTAYHAGVVGKRLFEELLRRPVEATVASEFRYGDPIVDETTLVIVISQSGETADTLAAMREAKRKGATTLAIVNVVGSTLAREADTVLYTQAGPEIGVASTKAYLAQVVALHLLALFLGQDVAIGESCRREIVSSLRALPDQIAELLNRDNEIARLAERLSEHNCFFYLGRGYDFAAALEAALKLKEISYIHAEAYAAGEMKHGPLALVEPGVAIVGFCTQPATREKMASNLREVKAREGTVVAIVFEGDEPPDGADEVVFVPSSMGSMMPVLTMVPMQLLAYHVARLRGCSIDQPRNLAKSVTVE